MYCPKCGQPQSSDEVRFCSRCGVNFDEVADFIASDSNNRHRRRDSVTKLLSTMAMYIVVAILAITGWGPWSGPKGTEIRGFAIIVSILTFILLFSRPLRRTIYQLFSHDSEQRDSRELIEPKSADVGATALPPAQAMPVTDLYQQRVNTAEMVAPHSVTEHTTALLEKK
jgi:hypothetical protein